MDERTSARLGTALMPLWADPQRWMHRIVESVSFVDAATIRRSRSFDLTVPRDAPALAGRTVLPLALLGRRVLSELDVSDDTGRRLPLLTADQNGAVSAALLVAAARQEGIADPDLLSLLRSLPTRQGGDLDLATAQLGHLGAHGGLIDLARALAAAFMVYVHCDAAGGQRTLIKLAYSEPLGAGGTRQWAQRFGWEPLELAFEVRAAGEASSYHFEVLAPEGGTIKEANIAVATPEQAQQAELPANQVAQRDESGRLAHLHLTGVPRSSAGKAVARLVPARTGWIATAVVAAWSTALVLIGALLTRGRLNNAKESSVTLLLVVNGLVSAIVARPSPHDLTAALNRGPRHLVLALAACTYVAAAGFVLSLTGAALEVTLIGCATVAVASAVALTRGWLNSR